MTAYPIVAGYQISAKLGEGSHGAVYLGTPENDTSLKVAIKVLGKKVDKYFNREVGILDKLGELIAMIDEAKPIIITRAFTSSKELADYIEEKGPLSKETSLKIFKQLVTQLKGYHDLGIVHRDLKPANILINDKDEIKIIDWGLGREIEHGRSSPLPFTYAGSPNFMSPEAIQNKCFNLAQSDIWSLGVILFNLSTGALPFQAENLTQLIRMVSEGKYTIPATVDPTIARLIRIMLVVDANVRINLKVLKELVDMSEEEMENALSCADSLEECTLDIQFPDIEPVSDSDSEDEAYKSALALLPTPQVVNAAQQEVWVMNRVSDSTYIFNPLQTSRSSDQQVQSSPLTS
jgi:serine/threonine protein kinase